MAMASAPVPSLVRVSFSSQANRQTHSSKQGLLGEDLVISLLTVLLTGSQITKGPGMLLIYLFLTLNLTSVHRAKLLYDSHHQCVVNQVCLCGWGFFERHPSQAQLMLSLSMETVTEEQPTSLPTYLPACLPAYKQKQEQNLSLGPPLVVNTCTQKKIKRQFLNSINYKISCRQVIGVYKKWSA